MDVSGRILRTWMPAIHAGMTKLCIFSQISPQPDSLSSILGLCFGCGFVALGSIVGHQSSTPQAEHSARLPR
jgi:hypothetical protein